MGFLTDLFAATGERTDLENPALWLTDGLAGRRTQSGEAVTPSSALTLPVLWSAVDRIRAAIGAFPVEVRRKRSGGRGSDPEHGHPAQELLDGSANPEMLAHVVRETLIQWALLWGNGWAEIERDNLGRPLALWPVHPSRARLIRVDGALVLEVQMADYKPGLTRMDRVHIPYGDVLHIRGMGDGQCGYSVVQMLAETIGTGLASMMFAASFFGNGAHPGGIISWPAGVRAPQDEAIKKLKAQWVEMYGGRRSLAPATLYDGATWQPMMVPPKDAQFVESGKVTRADLYGALNVPAHMVGDNEHSTFANVENLGLQFSIYTLLPWVAHCEKEFMRRLLTEQDRRSMVYVKHNMNALQRGDFMSRTAGYRTLISTAVMTPNEARDLEDMNPSEDAGAESLWMQGAMQPIEVLADPPEEEEPPPAPSGSVMPPSPMPPTSPATPEPEPEEEDKAEALRPVFLDVARRMVRKEAMACERAAKRLGPTKEYDAWLAEFWRSHGSDVRESFAPVFACCDASGASMVAGLVTMQRESEARRGGRFDETAGANALCDAAMAAAKGQ